MGFEDSAEQGMWNYKVPRVYYCSEKGDWYLVHLL